MTPDTTLVFTIWVAGQRVLRETVDAERPPDMQKLLQWHHSVTDLADENGQPWLIDVYDPAEDRHVRFGDAGGMVDPR